MKARPVISKPFINAIGLAVGLSLFHAHDFAAAPQDAAPSRGAAAAPNEWLTWGYDQERTLWNLSLIHI